MRLTSITVRNYRIHRELKVEFDPSRTLIGGLNEAGKSTLVEAAHRALFLKGKITGETQKSMVSRIHGGNPEVELSFDARGRSYRVSKRFSGATGTTTLTDLNGATYSGEEAESRLSEILGVDAAGGGRGAVDRVNQQWVHLWVWQGSSGGDLSEYAAAPKDELLARLQAGGGTVIMQSAVDAQVAEFITKRYQSIFNQKNGQPKRDSELGKAVQAATDAAQALTMAQAVFQKLEQAVGDFREADQAIAAGRITLAKLESERSEVEAKLDRVTLLRASEQTQQLAVTVAVDAHQSLLQFDTKIRECRDGIRVLRETMAPQQAETLRLQHRESETAEFTRRKERDYDLAVEAARAARRSHELATAYVKRFEKHGELAQLTDKLQKITEVRSRLAANEQRLAQLPLISAGQLQELQDREGRQATATAALEAMATAVEVIASSVTVRLGEASLDVGQSRILTEDTEIDVGPDIRLRIRPGGGTGLSEARRRCQTASHDLQQALDALGIGSVSDAAAVTSSRQDLESTIQADHSLLTGLGATNIEEEFSAAKNACIAAEAELNNRLQLVDGLVPPTCLQEAVALAAETSRALENAENQELAEKAGCDGAFAAHSSAVTAVTAHVQNLKSEEGQLSSLEAQLQVLLSSHGEEDDRLRRLAELRQERTDAEARLQATLNELAALQPELLKSDQTRLRRACEQCQTDMNASATKRDMAKGVLQNDGSTDPQADVAVAEANSRSAQERRQNIERRSQAVRLLQTLFADEQRLLAEQFTRPFVEKIASYLQCLFGTSIRAVVRLESDGFTGLELIRPEYGGGAWSFESLSAGAREQTAAAVRLAMAEVLAEGHDQCLPIIFDDAFAYSDPERVATLQRMLDLAADRGLQVIVVSCNPSDYAGLGAKTIVLRNSPVTYSASEPRAYGLDSQQTSFDAAEQSAVLPGSDNVTESQRQEMIAALRSAGGSSGNQSLRETLGWDAANYEAVKRDLVSSGRIAPGRGRGGSVALVLEEPTGG